MTTKRLTPLDMGGNKVVNAGDGSASGDLATKGQLDGVAAGFVAVDALFWNARDHGVAGDGTTVDSAALQALVITVAAAGGGTIYLPAGTYVISAVYLASNVTLAGAGMGATVLLLDPAATPGTNAIVIRVANGSSTAASWVTVRNLTIDGNKAAFPTPGGKVYGYYLGTGTTGLVTDCLVEGVEFRNCVTYALDIVDALRVSVTDCFSHDNGNPTGGTFTACSGFEILADDVTLVNCRAVNNAVKGFTSGEGGVVHRRTKLIGCTAQGNTQDGMYFHDGLTDSAILGGTSRDNTGSGVVLASAAVRNTVVGVTSSGNAVNGFRIDSGTFNIVSACIADANATASSGNPEIYLVNGAMNNSVIGCIVNSSTSSTSIVEHDTGDHNVFRSNTLNKTFTVVGANSTTADPVPGTVALLASPAFTGTPTAPTATAADNSTKLATTAYADGAVSTEKGRAQTAEALLLPKAGGTMTGPVAMGGNAITGLPAATANGQAVRFEQLPSVAGLAPLASPAFTGSPTAPTQAPADSTTRLATTAYADGAVAAETDRAVTAEAAALQQSANLSDLQSASAARTNLGLGSAALLPATAVPVAWGAADQGLVAWTHDIAASAPGSTQPLTTAGRLYTMAMKLPGPATVTNIEVVLTAVGATLTAGQCFGAVYQGYGGALLGVTADQSTTWATSGTNGRLSMPLAGGPVSAAAGIIIVALWYNGTTGPAPWRSNGNSGTFNLGLASSAARWGLANTGVTTTAPSTLGTVSASNVAAFWAAVS